MLAMAGQRLSTNLTNVAMFSLINISARLRPIKPDEPQMIYFDISK